ncbi:MAG: bifunctional methylenetetrahydrofolate dehydrogenase/methenyltetrahydrofolate cyclohydrolase FolD [Christensenellaceae bacterium]|jgi:methylenetetrahydrofolate dehydrogenase (NADP+)/methenyltetrahydrofolate cyclohydrolase|nr:bifunctional methylenetetrahydrofolate dehydrogenase/methenyltetrahydrofolate cyclohydrolase FolD [Christensenellaceae bacterium]
MAARIIDGKAIAGEARRALHPRVEALKARGIEPNLTVILVGDDPASAVYVRNKERAARELGFLGGVLRLPAETIQEELLEIVKKLNADEKVHGILVQLPLPKHISESAVLAAISPEKDVDGFHAVNAGRLMAGQPLFVPCTPKGVMRLLAESCIELRGKSAVVVGRSNIVGKPMAMLLLHADCTVTIAHSKTKDLPALCAGADILVAAIGRPKFITADMVKEGAVVIDVGINRVGEKKLAGDVDFCEAAKKASFITPVPGGVGAMTIAMLMENTVEAAERSLAQC